MLQHTAHKKNTRQHTAHNTTQVSTQLTIQHRSAHSSQNNTRQHTVHNTTHVSIQLTIQHRSSHSSQYNTGQHTAHNTTQVSTQLTIQHRSSHSSQYNTGQHTAHNTTQVSTMAVCNTYQNTYRISTLPIAATLPCSRPTHNNTRCRDARLLFLDNLTPNLHYGAVQTSGYLHTVTHRHTPKHSNTEYTVSHTTFTTFIT